jgi:glycosyltransferase involved in cell wall biosynthesis
MLRKALGAFLRHAPIINKYLSEKRDMYRDILTLEQHIRNMEENEKTKHGRLFTFSEKIPHIRFISNQLDATGAPLVFIDMMAEFIKTYPNVPISLNTFKPVDGKYLKEVEQIGIKTIVHERMDVEINFTRGDVVALNTAGHSIELKNSIYKSLEGGIAKKLVWYIQEDWPESFFSEEEKARIQKLLSLNKIIIFSPAKKALSNLQKFFDNTTNINKQPYKLNIPAEYHIQRAPEDFNKLNFLMVGKTGGGIKGHMPILYAFLAFKEFFYDKNPDKYRDFELRMMALEDDLLSKQIGRHVGELEKHFREYPPLPHEEALNVIRDSNITICYSMRECLPIFVFEGMVAGHPLLRNEVSGFSEQLENGENGYLLKNNSYKQVLGVIEQILNKDSTANKQLSNMSQRSNEIARKFENNNYEMITKAIHQSIKSPMIK